MSGSEHYREAERLLANASRWEDNVTDETDSYASIDSARMAAQAHATLALVAATVAPRMVTPQQPWGGHDFVIARPAEWEGIE